MQRRTFLKLAGMAPVVYASAGFPLARAGQAAGPTLVLVELKGGNDGLNTLIPYQDKPYAQLRPKIAIPAKDVLTLDEQVGMHPSLNSLLPLWDNGELGWLQGVGYANPNRSHFRAIEIWDTGKTADDADLEGWVPPLLQGKPLKGVAVDSSLGPLYTDDLSTIGLLDPLQFAKQGRRIRPVRPSDTLPALQHVLEVQDSVNELAAVFFKNLQKMPAPHTPFPKHAFGKALQAVYTMLVSGLDIPAYKVTLSGFDTHVNQLPAHARRLQMLAETLSVLRTNLQAEGLWNNTLLMSYSEFGRRVHENANGGTDHGTAAPHLLMGGRVKGGLYGRYPSLAELDQRGDLQYTLDFREVYAGIGQYWWRSPATSGQAMPNFIRS